MAAVNIAFTKMSGAGNDFVVVDNRRHILKDDLSTFVQAVSHRRTGIGADGVLILQQSSRADFLMSYYNSDGSFGGFCGNGGRCIARYALLNGIAPAHLTFEALDQIYHAEVQGARVRLKMMTPRDQRLGLVLQWNNKVLKAHALNTGAPHVVIFLDENPGLATTDLASVDLFNLGRKIRFDPFFGIEGTNVNIVAVNDDGSLGIRTYERGVEAETLACGTGSVAAALIASKVKALRSPQKVIPLSKEPLTVEFLALEDGFADVYLVGDTQVIFNGQLRYDSDVHRLME
jgi:diaminopimelate epimerase